MPEVREQVLHSPDGVLLTPAGDPRCAVLVLSGSSGRVDTDRARLLADHGAAAMAIRWFGGKGQPPGICEVELEAFESSLSTLWNMHPHLAVIGLSKGAEAALLLGAHDHRIRAVAALAPTSVVWANVGPGRDGRDRPQRSSWQRGGRALPFVPYDETWQPASDSDEPAYRSLYELSLRTQAAHVTAATIPVELIAGEVLVVAGADDQVWPSLQFAEQISDRRQRHGLATHVVTSPDAGHRVILPGESAPAGGLPMARGGNDDADRALGHQVWPVLCRLLNLQSS
jgi:hypothetical protein